MQVTSCSMHSIVTTFRGADIKVEVANFCAAMDTLIHQDVCPDEAVMACLILAVLDKLMLLKQLKSWSICSIKSAVWAASSGMICHCAITAIPLVTEWLRTWVASFTRRGLTGGKSICFYWVLVPFWCVWRNQHCKSPLHAAKECYCHLWWIHVF